MVHHRDASHHPTTTLALVFLVMVVLSFVSFRATALPAIIVNNAPRRDIHGNIMDAHDGKVLGPFPHLNHSYLWFAASYGMCKEPVGPSGCADAGEGNCGFQLNHNVSVWSSPNLVDWTPYASPAFQTALSGLPQAILFCPKVLYHNASQRWVLWANIVEGADFGISYYVVATANNFTGPFEIVSRNVTTLAYQDVGDFNLMQDDDGTAFIIYTSHITGGGATHRMSIEQLTPDYTATLGSRANSGYFGNTFVEAPAMFHREGRYYAVFGACCCYCESGSPVYVYTASHPLGPYTMQSGGPIDDDGSDSSDDTMRSVVSAPLENRQSAEREKAEEPTETTTAAATVCSRAEKDDQTSSATATWSRVGLLARARRPVAEPHVCRVGRRDRRQQRRVPIVGSSDDHQSPMPVHAQQTDIASYVSEHGERRFLWIGDRWQQSPDGIKGHDPTYWGALVFDDKGTVQNFTFVNSFTIHVAVP